VLIQFWIDAWRTEPLRE